MGKFSFKVFGNHHHTSRSQLEKRAPDASCQTGGFYKSPTAGQTLNASAQVHMAWDTSCLNTTAADIYLYSPNANSSVLQIFQNVDFQLGNYNATLKPQWWNYTSSIDMFLRIVESGTPAFLGTLPVGPVWHVNYTAPPGGIPSSQSNSNSEDPSVTVVNNLPGENKHHGVSKGGIAAAVLVPIIVIALAVGIYIKFNRVREEARRKRWSEAVDKRMSTISVDWRSMTKQGADAAVRASFAGSNRMSMARNSVARSSMLGAPRPSSTFAVEGEEGDVPEMSQLRRPGVGLRGPIPSTASATRSSRISFAADTRFSRASTGETVGRPRPSLDSRRAGVPSRAFHSAYIPPVPSLEQDEKEEDLEKTHSDEEDNATGAMSPTQRDGPLALSAADIRARVQNLNSNAEEPRPSIDEIAPALSMMRTGNDSQADLLIEPRAAEKLPPIKLETVTIPPAVATPKSPVIDVMPMQSLSAGAMMSPDDMLRVYAERRRTAASNTTSGSSPVISFPMPIASPVSPSGRTLYTPATASSSTAASSTNPFSNIPEEHQGRHSNETFYDNEDAYFGAAN